MSLYISLLPLPDGPKYSSWRSCHYRVPGDVLHGVVSEARPCSLGNLAAFMGLPRDSWQLNRTSSFQVGTFLRRLKTKPGVVTLFGGPLVSYIVGSGGAHGPALSWSGTLCGE